MTESEIKATNSLGLRGRLGEIVSGYLVVDTYEGTAYTEIKDELLLIDWIVVGEHGNDPKRTIPTLFPVNLQRMPEKYRRTFQLRDGFVYSYNWLHKTPAQAWSSKMMSIGHALGEAQGGQHHYRNEPPNETDERRKSRLSMLEQSAERIERLTAREKYAREQWIAHAGSKAGEPVEPIERLSVGHAIDQLRKIWRAPWWEDDKHNRADEVLLNLIDDSSVRSYHERIRSLTQP